MTRPLRHAVARGSLGLLLALTGALAACGDPTTAVQDDAACPGATCTDDVQARVDAIAAIDAVTRVDRVERTYGLDDGSVARAEVGADVADRDAAYAVGLAVLGELDRWPGQTFGVAEATVAADPAVEVDLVARESEDLTNPAFEPCASPGCADELDALRSRLRAEVDGVQDVRLEIGGGALRVTGTTGPDDYALAAAAARSLVVDARVRFADRLEVEMAATGPLVLTLRLEDGQVCAQPPGLTGCAADQLQPFEG